MFSKIQSKPIEGQALLLTVSEDVEANILESMLKASEIPVTKAYRSDGGFFSIVLGRSVLGVDIFVPEQMLDKAKEVLDSAKEIEDEDILSDPSFQDKSVEEENEDILNNLSKKALWMGVSLIAIVLIYLIFYFFLK